MLGVLTAAWRAGQETDGHQLRASMAEAAHWLADQRPVGGTVLPGLYFGRAGVAWALCDAGTAIGDDAVVRRAYEIALALPTSWPNPDVTHGLAGAGLAQLRLWQHGGDPRLLLSAQQSAQQLVEAAQLDDGLALWQVPPDFASRLAGTRHYGFAHGAAGIGYFLLATGQAAGDDSLIDLATQVGHGLCERAEIDEQGAARWPTAPGDHVRLPHWCSGSSGIGTFLLRLHDHHRGAPAASSTGRFRDITIGAATATYQGRWQSMPSACHGLAGDGQFLLDAADLLGDERYRAWADDLASLLAVRACRRNGRLVVPDETGTGVDYGYNTGLAGVVAFWLRLVHGGARLWMLDDLTQKDDLGSAGAETVGPSTRPVEGPEPGVRP